MTFTSQDFSDIFKFPFRDKQWFSKLCLQGALLMFLSFFLIGIPLLNGFMMRLLEQSIKDDPNLPDWSEWGTYWRLGWKNLAVYFVYFLPIFVVWSMMFFLSVIIQFIPSQIIVLMLNVLLFFISLLSYLFLLAYGLALGFAQNAYSPLIAVGAPMSQAFNIKGYLWPYIKHNALAIFIGFFISYLAGLIAVLGLFMFFIGYFFTLPYAMAVAAHVNGLIYRRSAIQYKRA